MQIFRGLIAPSRKPRTDGGRREAATQRNAATEDAGAINLNLGGTPGGRRRAAIGATTGEKVSSRAALQRVMIPLFLWGIGSSTITNMYQVKL